jgi:4-amino-4-deoxy-L-arabinose transferase-like glycosyltransferase
MTVGGAESGRGRSLLERPVLTFLLLALASLAYRLWGMSGDMRFDPIIYAQNAYNLLHGTFTLRNDSCYAHRLPVFFPVAPLYALFGVHALSSRIWPLLFSQVQLALLLWIGRRLFNPGTACLAAAFLVLSPLDAVFSGVLQPDVFLAGFLAAAAVFWILALEDSGGARAVFPLLSGLAFALAVLSREDSSALALFYLASALWKKPRPRILALAAAGVALAVGPLLIAYAVQTGDPFYRLKVMAGTYTAARVREGARFSYYLRLLFHPRYTALGPFPALFFLGAAGALIRPNRARGWLLFWSLSLLLYLQFGSLSLTHYLPVLKRERLLMPLSVPLSLLAASVLLGIWAWLRRRLPWTEAARRRSGAALLVLLLGFLAGFSSLIVRDTRAAGEATDASFRSLARAIESRPGLPVLFDHWRTGFRASYYLGFREGADFYRGGDDHQRMGRPGQFGNSRLGYLCWYPDTTAVPASLIVLEDEALERVKTADEAGPTFYPGEIPEYAYHPPASWKLLDRFGSIRLFERAGPAARR